MTDTFTPGPSKTPLRPRRRGRRPLLVAMLMLILFPCLAFVLWSRVQTHRLDEALDIIEARGDRLNPASFELHPQTAEQEEAARLYGDAARLAAPLVTARFLPAEKTIEDVAARPRAEAATDRRLALLRQQEAPLDAALRAVDRAAALDALGPRRDDRPFFPPISLAAAGKVRVARLALSGDGDSAARALVSIMRLRRMDPFWFRPFTLPTRDSLRLILTFADPSDVELQALQREYATLDLELDVVQLIMYRRAVYLRVALPSEFGDAESGAPQRTNPLETLLTRLARPLRASAILPDLPRYDAVLGAARQPWPAKLDDVSAIVEASGGSSPEPVGRPSWLRQLVRPWGSAALANLNLTAIADSVSYARVSLAALAIARYRVAHAGALPPTLGELVPAYLPDAPVDPYSGRELVYRRAGTSYRIYSVGRNRQDDGGTWVTKSDLSINRRENQKDLGIAVGVWPRPR